MVENDSLNQVDLFGLESWKPNKCDCDALRAKYIKAPNSATLTEAEARTSAAVSAAIQTTIHDWEYNSVWYRDPISKSFGFTAPVPNPTGPSGGPMIIKYPHGTTLAGQAHSHNVSYAEVSYYLDSIGARVPGRDEYDRDQNSFSGDDIGDVALVNSGVFPAMAIQKPNGTFALLTPAAIPSGWSKAKPNLPGQILTGMPTEEEMSRLVACTKNKL
jgi:hypothetical protein